MADMDAPLAERVAAAIELAPEAHTSVGSDRRVEIASRLQPQVKMNVGINVEVIVTDPAMLQRSSGKACRVIDRRKVILDDNRERKAAEGIL